jgi:hypothetical protein
MIRFKVNRAGIRDLLKSEGVKADLKARAERVAAAARAQTDMPIKVEGAHGRIRARYHVVADAPEARAVEAKTRLLGRAMDAARG